MEEDKKKKKLNDHLNDQEPEPTLLQALGKKHKLYMLLWV